MNIFELRKQRQELTLANEGILGAAADSNRALTEYDQKQLVLNRYKIAEADKAIAQLEGNNTITRFVKNGTLLVDGPRSDSRGGRRVLGAEYARDLHQLVASNGKNIGPALLEGSDGFGGYALPTTFGALYEGSNTAGGYAVPVTVDDQIVPLAPQEMAVRRLAQVLATTNDIKVPTKSAFSTATAKAETSAFTESEPTIGQFTLSAYMAGVLQEISWELAQDVPAFQAFAVDDMILAQQMYEENLYINGTGSGQPQGLIGNVGNGGTYEPDSSSNLVSIAGLLAIQAKLNAVYHPNASWLMSRATSIIIRTAQMQSNLFFPAFTRDANGQDRLFGYPVEYSAYMPTAARGAAPVLFGDFKRSYIIGDRGGSGINVKVLDQPLATQGLIQILAYRRTDGRVRRSEAIQQYNIASS